MRLPAQIATSRTLFALAAVLTTVLGASAPSASAVTASVGSAASYMSEPTLHPPNVISSGHSAAKGGFFFIDPFAGGSKPIVGQAGAQILDAQGATVWFRPATEGEQVVDFRAQSYRGKPVLTWWQGTIAIPPKYTNLPAGSPEPGAHFYVYDNHYRLIRTIGEQEGWIPDLHEFLLTANGNAAFIAAKLVPMNLTPYGGPANGSVEDSAIREVNLRTGKLVFQWDMLQHVALSEAQVAPPAHGVWDPFHMNSLEPLPHGRYLISARNTWAIYEIDASSGNVVWQLGGRGSSFALAPQASFYWQHDARALPGEEISLFDDGCCNFGPTGLQPAEQEAHGLVLKLDMTHHTATVARTYTHEPPLHVPSQGNLQTLADGNALVGWGQLPYYSEYSRAGKLLYDVALPEADESYRALRLPWTGQPRTRPSVVALRAAAHTTVYVSWNGATEVSRWEVLAGNGRHLRIVARSRRRGFETAINVKRAGPLFQVKALDRKGRVIGSSARVRSSRTSARAAARRSAGRFAGAQAVSQTVTVKAGAVAVKVSCPTAAYRRCSVKLTLRTARAINVGGRSQILTLGSGAATIAAGRSGTVHVKLSASALGAIKSAKGTLTPNAIASSRDGHGHAARRSRKITIREAGASSGTEEPTALY